MYLVLVTGRTNQRGRGSATHVKKVNWDAGISLDKLFEVDMFVVSLSDSVNVNNPNSGGAYRTKNPTRHDQY